MNKPQSPPRTLSDFLAYKAISMRVPLSGTFELSPVCNFACRMCYVRKTQAEVDASPRRPMTLDDWLSLAEQARDAGTLYLLLTGGEPLLWPQFFTLYDTLIDMGFLISVNTNGSLIDETAAARFLAKPPQKINITLYGANDATYRRLCGADGVFSRVDRAIRMLTEAGIRVKINCSLTPENASDLDFIVEYAKARGAQLSVAAYMFPPIRRDPTMTGQNERFTPEESAHYTARFWEKNHGRDAYLKHMQAIRDGYAEPRGLDESCIDPVDGKIHCRAGKASYWITWDGYMTPCGMMPEPKVDLRKLSFADSWHALTETAAKLTLSGVCDSCPNLNVCHPCAAIAYAETGSCAGIPTYMCRMTQALHRIACTLPPPENRTPSPHGEEI
ncbi:MAG: radical SAM protein [Clostridia bacterium]|nr:radical SAM protein [Clostridia bacterium]